MGALVEQKIETLFHGVSRQPDTVRLPGQVQEANNVLMSVVSGGFTDRAGTEHLTTVSAFPGVSSHFFYSHAYMRDESEKYMILIQPFNIYVIDLNTGQERTVNYAAGNSYLTIPGGFARDQFAVVTVADYTFIVNKTKTVAMSSSRSPDPRYRAVLELTGGQRFGRYIVNVNGTEVGVADTADREPDLEREAIELETDLITNLGSGWTVNRESTAIEIRKNDFSNFEINATSTASDTYIKFVKDKVQAFSDLPSRAVVGMIVQVAGDRSSDFSGYYVKFESGDGSTSGIAKGVWRETVAPNIPWEFDATTMPHLLVRESDGTFTFKTATWNKRLVGDEVTVPNPDFVGRKINDVVFFRDRLAFLADETVYFSQAGDYFNFWPDKSIEILDSDPFGRAASTNQVNILQYAVPFNQTLFVTSQNAQFEISGGDSFTPKNAAMAQSTAYRASTACRPVALTDTLYFGTSTDKDTVVFEYWHDQDRLTNTAVDVTKHVQGYVPAPITQMNGDSVTNTLFAISGKFNGVDSRLFVFSVYWNGEDKVQSAWNLWDFNSDGVNTGTTVYAAHVLGGRVFLPIARGDELLIESVTLSDEFDIVNNPFTITSANGINFPVRLDRRVLLTGVYDSGTDTTTWTLPYKHRNWTVAVMSDDYSTPGHMPPVAYPTATTMTASGDFSSADAIIGIPYRRAVTLSKQYVREGENQSTVVSGRLQLKSFSFNYVNTGYFEVEVTPEFRAPVIWKYTGRLMGSGNNLTGGYVIEPSGTFRIRPNTRAETAKIVISNSSIIPMTITSASWTGFFNEITRQE